MALLAGFAGVAWAVWIASAAAMGAAALRKDLRIAALATVLLAGTLHALNAAGSQHEGVQSRRRTSDSAEQTMLQRARTRAGESIDRTFRTDAPVARALLIADQHQIPPELRDRYARSGMIHMLSISGLHVAIIAGAVTLMLQALRVRAGAASLISVMVIAGYVAILGAPAPALRSAVMLATVAAARAFQRPTSPWASLALGAFVPLYQARTILDLGYQLSVVGIAGLIASAALKKRILEPRLGGWRLRISSELATSTVATLITAPLICWYFGRLSLIAPLTNLAAGPLMTVLQPTLFLALLAAPLPGLASFIAAAAHPMLALFDGIATTGASMPGASVAVIPSLVSSIAAAVMACALIVACLSRYPLRPVVLAAGASVVIVWSPAIRLPVSSGMEMHVLDVGQGDAILVRTDRGRWLLFDAGRIWKRGDAGRSTIIPYVMRRGGKLAAFILSHAHADHVGGAESVMRALRPALFFDAGFPQGSGVYETTLRAAAETGVEWRRVPTGDSVQIDSVTIHFLAPDSAWTASLADPNDASTIAVVRFGFVRFLLVGDAEAGEETWLLENARDALDVDVLKVGHHGSSTSSSDAFLAAVTPALAIISVGADNLYGHPSNDVLAALTRVEAQVMRTDQEGTIVVRTDGKRVTAEARGVKWDISRD